MKFKIGVIYGLAAFLSTSFPNNAFNNTGAKHVASKFSCLANLNYFSILLLYDVELFLKRLHTTIPRAYVKGIITLLKQLEHSLP